MELTKKKIHLYLGHQPIKSDNLLAFYASVLPASLLDPQPSFRSTHIARILRGWVVVLLAPSARRVVVFHTHSTHVSARAARRYVGKSGGWRRIGEGRRGIAEI